MKKRYPWEGVPFLKKIYTRKNARLLRPNPLIRQRIPQCKRLVAPRMFGVANDLVQQRLKLGTIPLVIRQVKQAEVPIRFVGIAVEYAVFAIGIHGLSVHHSGSRRRVPSYRCLLISAGRRYGFNGRSRRRLLPAEQVFPQLPDFLFLPV